MSTFSKRKRKTREMRCVLFPEDVTEAFHRRNSESSKSTGSWERCGESFLDSAVVKKLQTSGPRGRAGQRFRPSSTPVRSGEEDAVHIAWSSSEEDQSDHESQLPHHLPSSEAPERCRPCPRDVVSSSSRCLRLLRTGADMDDPPTIDSESDSEHQDGSPLSKEQSPVVVAEISDYSSSDSERAPGENSRLDFSALQPTEHRQRSVSEWVRSAQVLLQTPQKEIDRTSKTPEDSGKKRRRFECGGLAERLNRLQCRQRSAISFWRHQSVSGMTSATEDRPGVLVLRVCSVWEVCGMQAALCDRPAHGGQCIALFSKDTATHLEPTVGDTVCVYPPWQSLTVEGERHPIILNTHFSQKVLSEVKQDHSVTYATVTTVPSAQTKSPPYPLTRGFWKSEILRCAQESTSARQVCAVAHRDTGGPLQSILEAVEASGPAGSICGPVEAVVQRVYAFPVQPSPTTNSLRHRPVSKARPRHIGRLCALMQDVYGMFGEVELQYISSEEELQQCTEQLGGKVCVLQGLKVIQRLTRERCAQLFSLIDSLWPPLVPVRVDGEQPCHQTNPVPSPSFCYRLSGPQGCVQPQDVSPLYRPAVLLTLQEVLQMESTGSQYSFKAAVVYKREESEGEDLLLFVTDRSLQRTGSDSRTLPVFVRSSCLLQASVRQALTSLHLRPTLVFKDVTTENGQIFCWGQTVIQLDSEQVLNPKPVLLDQLSLESAPCTLCSVEGVVVDVDEASAFSWPTCSQCGSDCLEEVQNEQDALLCVSCGAVDKPTTKMQLEVFVSCPSMSHCTVKVKGYEVETVLRKKLGPLSAFIHVVSRTSSLWMSLEEILL
ncbi:DNA repair-scaffolding protein isoform X2 [Hoplias malabaricus]|uniref:DNA repair-scaffolding protein isoform X2 n=1 Tax=Hoplias malabaricus TaxID=27720 RepID=UPI003461B3C1